MRSALTPGAGGFIGGHLVRRLALIAGWALAVLVVFLTLGPVSDRPQLGHPQFERFAAYLALGLCWGAAYPARLWRVLLVLTAAAVLLEMAQALAPGRDPGVIDAIVEVAGAVVGVGLVAAGRRAISKPA
jgi:VanZ family protein